MNRSLFTVALVALLSIALVPGLSAAAGPPHAVPFEFVGTEAQCGTGNGGSRIVTAEWVDGLGLPDNILIGNDDTSAVARRDQRRGLLLSKNGLTSNCSAPGARITGVYNHTFSELGFDYRNGTHCGNGAPRFNVVLDGDPAVHFGGCAFGVHTAAPQDDQWTRVRLSGADFFPPIPEGAPISSISIVYDEGTDQGSVDDPNGVGLSILDNIFIDGDLITKP
jgi:hypothetical protein